MGWLGYTSTRSGAIERELQDLRVNFSVLKSRAVGNCLWYVVQNPTVNDGKPFIGLSLMELEGRAGTRVWVKHLDEASGPYYYTCPLSFLAASECEHPLAVEWRAKVRAYHARRAAIKKLQPGQVVRYGGVAYRLEARLPGGAWNVTAGGFQYRMKRHQVADAEIVS